MKASKKEIYGSRGVTLAATNGNGDKLDESLQSVLELALESRGGGAHGGIARKICGPVARRTASDGGAKHALHQHDSRRAAAGVSGRPRHRTAHQKHHPLERDGDGGEGELKHERRRPHRIVCVIGDALRSGAESFFSRTVGRFSGRPGLFSRPRRAGNVCARVSRRPFGRSTFAKFPAGTCAGRRLVVVSASIFDAGILAVPDRLDGVSAQSCRCIRRGSIATCRRAVW